MKDFENARDIVANGTFETVLEKVKELPAYGMFKKAVNEGSTSDETEELLTLTTLMFTMGDRDMGLLMTSVSINMLFSVLNMRLRSELGSIE